MRVTPTRIHGTPVMTAMSRRTKPHARVVKHRQMPQILDYFGMALGESQVKALVFVPASCAGSASEVAETDLSSNYSDRSNAVAGAALLDAGGDSDCNDDG
jgi:hypothetical protein